MAGVDPEPVMVGHLLAPERAALLGLLEALDEPRWQGPTACPGWSVKDVVAHLLGDDLGLLSRRRDGFTPPGTPRERPAWRDLVAWLDRENQAWVEAARRLSPRLLRELLAVTAEATRRHLAGLDPLALEARVSWAGPGPFPNWLDVAREYAERWVHQQQVRDAVGEPGLKEPAFLAPVLATFVHALPPAFAGAAAPPGSTVEVTIRGEAGGTWTVARTPEGWRLGTGVAAAPAARVALDAETAWRRWTKGIGAEAALAAAEVSGDRPLGRRVLDAVAIIA
jgi:uncharacterized protein (TIGR03083 family)